MTQKYNYIERVREKAGQRVGEEEDKRVLALVDALITANSGQLHTSLLRLLLRRMTW